MTEIALTAKGTAKGLNTSVLPIRNEVNDHISHLLKGSFVKSATSNPQFSYSLEVYGLRCIGKVSSSTFDSVDKIPDEDSYFFSNIQNVY